MLYGFMDSEPVGNKEGPDPPEPVVRCSPLRKPRKVLQLEDAPPLTTPLPWSLLFGLSC